MDELTERLAVALTAAVGELEVLSGWGEGEGMPCVHDQQCPSCKTIICTEGSHPVGLTVDLAPWNALLEEVRRDRILSGQPTLEVPHE